MKILIVLITWSMLVGCAFAAQPTENIPISQMPISTTLKTNAWVPIIQPYTGRITNDNFRVSPQTIGQGLVQYIRFTTNFVVNDWGLIISNAPPVSAPYWTNTLWVNAIDSRLWIWDNAGSVWIGIDPSKATGMYAVATVADLRLIDDNGVLQWATTHGNVAPDDGQGRRYWWNAGDTSTDDDISIIKPDSIDSANPGRWNEE